PPIGYDAEYYRHISTRRHQPTRQPSPLKPRGGPRFVGTAREAQAVRDGEQRFSSRCVRICSGSNGRGAGLATALAVRPTVARGCAITAPAPEAGAIWEVR